MARKVYEAVPIGQAWDIHQIMGEMRRMNGTVPAPDVVKGRLLSMEEAGLLKLVDGDRFQRVQGREVSRQAQQPVDAVAEKAPTVAPDPSPEPEKKPNTIAELGAIAQALRAQAAGLIALADRVELAALQVDDDLKAASQDLEKLHTLRSLLATI